MQTRGRGAPSQGSCLGSSVQFGGDGAPPQGDSSVLAAPAPRRTPPPPAGATGFSRWTPTPKAIPSLANQLRLSYVFCGARLYVAYCRGLGRSLIRHDVGLVRLAAPLDIQQKLREFPAIPVLFPAMRGRVSEGETNRHSQLSRRGGAWRSIGKRLAHRTEFRQAPARIRKRPFCAGRGWP